MASIGTDPTNNVNSTRNRLLTAGVIVATAVVWAVVLGVVDRFSPKKTSSSPTARVEQRPALFVVSRMPEGEQGRAGGGERTIGAAIPLALVEPNGDLQAIEPGPVDQAIGYERFVASYYKPGTSIRLLRGGGDAGTLRIEGKPMRPPNGPPLGRGPCDGADLSQVPAGPGGEVALGVTDRRFARPRAMRPMRESDQAIVETLAGRIIAEHYPKAETVGEAETRIQVTDFNRDDVPEIVASRVVRLKGDAGTPRIVSLFMIVERVRPASQEDGSSLAPASPSYRTSLVLMLELTETAPRDRAFAYVDQIALSASEFDEIIVSGGSDSERVYMVFRRDGEGWREIYRTSAPSLQERARDGGSGAEAASTGG